MRNKIYILSATILIASCTRDYDPPLPPDPVLKRTVQTDTSGAITRIMYYNEFELVTFDSVFYTGTRNAGMINLYTYNVKGKLTRHEYLLPVIYTGGYYWAWQYSYQNDTLLTATHRYFKGNQVAHITHFHNASRQLIMDSTYHTPNYGIFTYLNKYAYDASGRLSSSLELNDTRDTVNYTTYQYAPNRIEQSVIHVEYNPVIKSNTKIVTEYNTAGKMVSEKQYGGQALQLVSQTDYLYDAANHLLKKTMSATGNPSQEDRYFNNPITGKHEKMEHYENNQLRYVITYYYE
jgi:hypothetical protein